MNYDLIKMGETVYNFEEDEGEKESYIIDTKKVTIILLIGICIYAIVDAIIIATSGYNMELLPPN
ncbi:hypothetical protein BFU36_06905 [Sulfolobus sp. A20]|nr:hypothetical protein BFU36_06905 [Sulfolobus sp. A20]TRM75228.1 hypothetical protein DJ532_10780 [Sulfolobus sp. A20-N-F8]TRM78996.1 hypothetical protein DJ528_03150 [Sulfolobus sp. B5]TRM82057.1 hypothetical protein DJ524_01975 [Sulfolobus sp. D5]TRM83583.1 hypothetical protein DJ531_04890 [Sulfolobus sp. A20-N-F6]TRM88149.1 hypothetical protein DJ521_02400 [Sulfolobus sp. E3]TRM88334.1 hypothetical protein DJ529_05680 [Sulfolobus sp. C3]TRM95306.1 hypothetical protein DJ526_00720 [Sulfo